MKAISLNDSNKAVALIYKSGSSSLIKAIIDEVQTEQSQALQDARLGEGMSSETGQLHAFTKMEDATGKQVLMLVREPVEKFRSAVAQIQKNQPDKTVEDILVLAEAESPINPHLWPIEKYLDGYSSAKMLLLYKFPEQLDDMAVEAGLTLPLPVLNESEAKPDLTEDQIARVQARYSKDLELYDSITESGMPLRTENSPSIPPLADRLKALNSGLPADIRAQLAPLRAGLKELLAEGDLEAGKVLIQDATIPAELEPVRTQMLTEFDK